MKKEKDSYFFQPNTKQFRFLCPTTMSEPWKPHILISNFFPAVPWFAIMLHFIMNLIWVPAMVWHIISKNICWGKYWMKECKCYYYEVIKGEENRWKVGWWRYTSGSRGFIYLAGFITVLMRYSCIIEKSGDLGFLSQASTCHFGKYFSGFQYV